MSTWLPKACCVAVSVALVFTAMHAAWGDGDDDAFAGFQTASVETLANTRGGFVATTVGGQSLDLSFGITQAVLINDQLVVATKLTVPTVSRLAEAHIDRFISEVVPNVPASPAPVVQVQSAGTTPTPPTTPQQTVTIQNTGSPIGPVQVTTSVVNQLKVSTVQSQNGQLNLVQVGAGNTFDLNLAQLPKGTFNIIQNTLNNQTIRQQTEIQLSANTLSLIRSINFGAMLQRQIAGSLR